MRKHSVAHGSVNKLNKVKFFGLLIKIPTPVKIQCRHIRKQTGKQNRVRMKGKG